MVIGRKIISADIVSFDVGFYVFIFYLTFSHRIEFPELLDADKFHAEQVIQIRIRNIGIFGQGDEFARGINKHTELMRLRHAFGTVVVLFFDDQPSLVVLHEINSRVDTKELFKELPRILKTGGIYFCPSENKINTLVFFVFTVECISVFSRISK